MPKRQGQESQNQRRGGDLDGKRSRPARRRKHLYLILDDWEKGFSVHKIDTDDFDSDSDDDPDAGAAVAGHLPDPPALRLASPGDADMLFAAAGSKIFIVTDARYGQTPALVYDAETAGLAIGPAVPAQLQCGFSIIVSAREMIYAFSPPTCNKQHSFDAMSCAPIGRHDPDEQGWSWRSLPAPPPPFDAYDIITSYAVHSDGLTIFITTSYRDRPGLQKRTCSFNTKYRVWRWHPWVLPFEDQGYCNTCPDTPAVGPNTPDMEFLVHIIFVHGAHNHLNRKHNSLSPSLSLSPVTSLSLTSLTSSPSPPNPKLQIPHPESISRPRRLRIRVEGHLPRELLPRVPWISSSSRTKSSS
ncbi:uncharacterized protein LOC120694718 [Panicum virgatum]|uniref:uncharacterized protein LOC120694718 n=1 Tax=Panicum virgatum TaxID=38727 RepID=UPI0019D5619C|nr:uncharacterized protein LOC120694718 [Panicum virgatum]XP_039833864.1 uncharacterized protein LOC120694718 [Panicum virgatum]